MSLGAPGAPPGPPEPLPGPPGRALVTLPVVLVVLEVVMLVLEVVRQILLLQFLLPQLYRLKIASFASKTPLEWAINGPSFGGPRNEQLAKVVSLNKVLLYGPLVSLSKVLLFGPLRTHVRGKTG